jgi:uncharacterized membrane protein YfcA
MWFYLYLLLFGTAVGVAGGLLGLGGGIALVPGLILLFGFTQQEAQGTSLAVMIPPIGIFAAMVYYQHNYIRLPVVGWVAAGFMIGAYVGARLVPHVPREFLQTAFGAALLYTGFLMVFTAASTRISQPAAALPAGVAAIVSFLFAVLSGRARRKSPRAPQPAAEDWDYHI